MSDTEINPDKVRAVLAHALAGLDAEDVAERVNWCRQHGVAGAIMHPADVGELVEFEFGGRTLGGRAVGRAVR